MFFGGLTAQVIWDLDTECSCDTLVSKLKERYGSIGKAEVYRA